MNFVLPTPSLQHVAQVNIVAALWNQRDIIKKIARTADPEFIGGQLVRVKEWRAIEERVKSHVWALPLPEPCKKQLAKLIQLLGMEILNWRDYHNAETNTFQALNKVLPGQFYWSMRGTIDYVKTAATMVYDYRVDLQRRYEIACINCLEDAAGELMLRIGEYRMGEYVDGMRSDGNKRRHRDLIMFFTYTLGGESLRSKPDFQPLLSRGNWLLEYLFELAVLGGNRATSDYLFNKFSPGEKTPVLEECIHKIFRRNRAPINCSALYYFSLMNEEQRRRVFEECTAEVLVCLLGWPMQALFLEAAQCGLPFLSQVDYKQVLNAIVSKIRLGLRDYDYLELFWEFWRSGPPEYRRYFLSKSWDLEALIETREEEIIKWVLKEISPLQILALCDSRVHKVLMDESVISDAALMECKQTAALNSENDDEEDEEKRTKSRYLSQLINVTLYRRVESREKSERRRSTKKMKKCV